jgi:hypothetical protein
MGALGDADRTSTGLAGRRFGGPPIPEGGFMRENPIVKLPLMQNLPARAGAAGNMGLSRGRSDLLSDGALSCAKPFQRRFIRGKHTEVKSAVLGNGFKKPAFSRRSPNINNRDLIDSLPVEIP